MSRAQCIVYRGNAVLMVKTHCFGETFYCLPGGGIEPGETPEEAAVRELAEECRVDGKIVRQTAVVTFDTLTNSLDPRPDDQHFTYLMDIGGQEPSVGYDPEFPDNDQIIMDIAWLTLPEMSERDRVFLWNAGLLTIPCFSEEVHAWGRDLSYPNTRTASTQDLTPP